MTNTQRKFRLASQRTVGVSLREHAQGEKALNGHAPKFATAEKLFADLLAQTGVLNAVMDATEGGE